MMKTSRTLRILAAAEIPIGSRRAHAINVVKTAGGFARLGHDVTLAMQMCEASADPKRLLSEYGEEGLKLELFDPASGVRFSPWVRDLAVNKKCDVVYARHFIAAIDCAEAGIQTILETHAYLDAKNAGLDAALAATRHASRPLALVTTISSILAEHFVERGGNSSRIVVIPDGVDFKLFARPKTPAPSPYGDGEGAFNVVYAGHLYDHKGVPAMLHAASELAGRALLRLIGGLDEDIARVAAIVAEKKLTNVHLHGFVPHAQLPPCLWHADVLVMPTSAMEPSAAWTSPVKLGEYLAAGRPIVASDIPGHRAWVDEPLVRWCKPDNGADLMRAILDAASETDERRSLREREAERLARAYSYEQRATHMLESLTAAGQTTKRGKETFARHA